MAFDSATVAVSFAVGSIVCLLFYVLCKLRKDLGPLSPILLAEEKKQALEKETRDKLMTCLEPYCVKIQEEHLKFVIQCCDIEREYCSSVVEDLECIGKDDIDESDLSYSPRIMLPMGMNDYGKEFEEKSAKCAVCLEEYTTGDTVVRSNRDCPHLFHLECILTWLTKSTVIGGGENKYSCPMCRQLFVVDEEEEV